MLYASQSLSSRGYGGHGDYGLPQNVNSVEANVSPGSLCLFVIGLPFLFASVFDVATPGA